MIKKSEGVTLISLVLAVIVILILSNIVVFNLGNGLSSAKLKRLQEDIENLRGRVSNYYAQYGAIPTGAEYTNIDNLEEEGIISKASDTGKFYVLELSKLENLILNYGEDYKKITEDMTTEQVNEYTDLYIINETSHNIFYVKGIRIGKKVHFTDYNADEVDTEAVDLKYIDNVKIPTGYRYISGNKNTGITIEGTDGNQFVWVPVENIEEFVGEEAVDLTAAETEEEKMYKSVNLNKGFYIGKTETSKANSDETSKEVVATQCYEAEENAITRWVDKNNDIAKTLNYEGSNLRKRIALYLTNEEKWSEIYYSQNGKELTYKDKYENEVYIPNGFQVSEQEGSNKISDGLVIKNSITQDRYVWIAIPQSAFGTAKKETDYEAIEKDLKQYTSSYSNSEYSDTYHSDCGIENEQKYNELKNKMLSSLYKNKGFWISQYEIGASDYARYEESIVTRNATSQENQYPYNYLSAEEAQNISDQISSGDKTSSLLFGVQWDLVCKFIAENSNKDVTNSGEGTNSWANYKNSKFVISKGKFIQSDSTKYTDEISENYNKDGETLLTTGITTRNCALNIYDFAGNVAEWTLEKGPDNLSVVRGGSYKDESSSAIARSSGSSEKNVGFRIAIY